MGLKLNLKKHKKRRNKLVFYLVIIYFTFAFTYYYSVKNSNIINNEKLITYLLKSGNIDNLEKIKLTNIVSKTINLVFKVNIKNPTSLLKTTVMAQKEEIKLEYADDYSNVEQLKEISDYIEDPYKTDINNPVVYLYNTHQLENYSSDNLDIYGITPNVLMVSYLLKEKLNKNNISTIVEDTNVYDFLQNNGWDYTSSYKASRILLLDKKNKYSTLKYFIDIHRDSVSKDMTTVTIQGKDYAKILFVIGMENPNNSENLAFVTRINNVINQHYPGLSRGILKKEGNGVDGVYNQDISKYTILIELGGKENNINEVLNTIEALSEVISITLKEENT